MLGIFLDSETNGLDPFTHVIIEIGIKVVDMATGESLGEYATPIHLSEAQWAQSSKESLAINGFTYASLQNAPSPHAVATDIKAFFKQHKIKRGSSVFICQNPSFDRIFFAQLLPVAEQERLYWPYHWLDLASMFWALRIKEGSPPWDVGLSKNKMAKAYGIKPEPIPHKAINGVNHLLACYRAIVGFVEPKTHK